MTPEHFWNATVGEIIAELESYHKRRENEIKETFIGYMRLSEMIAANVWNDGKRSYEVWDFVPFFEKEKEEATERKAKAELEVYKAKFEQFAIRHNATVHGNDINTTGDDNG